MTERTKSLLGIAAAAAITLGPSAGTAAAASYAGASTLTAIAVGATTSGILLGILVTITIGAHRQLDMMGTPKISGMMNQSKIAITPRVTNSAFEE